MFHQGAGDRPCGHSSGHDSAPSAPSPNTLEDMEETDRSLWSPQGRPHKSAAEQIDVELGEQAEGVDPACRDPKGINKCLKVAFEDVIAEPGSVRSFDRVWLWSHALFEVSRLWSYRLISLALAVPVSLAAGLVFAVLSCLHIWLIMPCLQLCLIKMYWVQSVWSNVLNIAIGPFFTSVGNCWGSINIRLARD